MRHILPISGKDSLATAIVQTQRAPELPYEFIFNDVGAELPETYKWLSLVEEQTGWNIIRIGADLTVKIRSYGGFLPSGRARYCTKEGKIEPMQEYLGGSSPKEQLLAVAMAAILKGPAPLRALTFAEPCMIYYGLRADEQRTGYVPLAGSLITPCYPLQEEGIGLSGVYALLDAHNLTPPSFFWSRLFEAVNAKMKPVFPEWESQLSRMERDILFAGRTRANCYFCFFQRQYEYIWLAETHPDLFGRAASFENVGSDYTWRQGYALKELLEPERAAGIFESRVRWVCGQIALKLQLSLFEETGDNEITAFSCGLLCGK